MYNPAEAELKEGMRDRVTGMNWWYEKCFDQDFWRHDKIKAGLVFKYWYEKVPFTGS